MKDAQRYAIVLVTAPDLETGRSLTRLALEARLVACGNIVPSLESHYWWKGKIENNSEVLILFKTTAKALPQLEKLILSNHPYDTAEILALAPGRGTQKYLGWLGSSVRGSRRPRLNPSPPSNGEEGV